MRRPQTIVLTQGRRPRPAPERRKPARRRIRLETFALAVVVTTAVGVALFASVGLVEWALNPHISSAYRAIANAKRALRWMPEAGILLAVWPERARVLGLVGCCLLTGYYVVHQIRFELSLGLWMWTELLAWDSALFASVVLARRALDKLSVEG